MNDPRTDALLIVISSCQKAADYLRKTHDYNAWIPIDRSCEGCDLILALENAANKAKHALNRCQP